MNIKYFLMTAAVVLSVASVAMAEGSAQATTAVKAGVTTGRDMTAPANAPAPVPFDTMKASVLKMMGERIADMQKRQSCVQAAADQKAFAACFPNMTHPGVIPMETPGGMTSTPSAPAPTPGASPSMPGDKPAH